MRNALALAIGILAVTSAAAQSSVTIYGIVDAGIQLSGFGGGLQTNLASGMADGSRIGFKGAEDVGGGYKVIFNMEARVEVDTGAQSNGYLSQHRSMYLTRGLSAPVAAAIAPSLNPRTVLNPERALFDRTSMVGLITPVGAFLAGRQYTPVYEVAAMADTFEAGTAAGWGQVLQGAGGILTTGAAIRANNSLQYRLEKDGLGMSLMAARTQTGSLNLSKSFYGGNLRFKNETWNVGAGYQKEQDQNGQSSLTTLLTGGSLTIENVKLFAGYARMRNSHSPIVPLLIPAIGTLNANIVGRNAKLDANSYTLGSQYRRGRDKFFAAISYTQDRSSQSRVTLYGVGHDHQLSRLSDVYTVLAYATNRGNAQYALGGAGTAGGFTKSPAMNAASIQVGMRHRW